MTARRPLLAELARRVGVIDAYHDLTGQLRETSDATRQALCRAMGWEAEDEASAQRSIEAIERREAERVLEPVSVWREHDAPLAPAIRVRPRRRDRAERVCIELHEEAGVVHRMERDLTPRPGGGPVQLRLPARPGPGRHLVRVVFAGTDDAASEQWCIVAPRTAFRVQEKLAGGRGFGVWTNLYTLRRARDQGIGDLTALADLSRACGAWGGDFVGLSPLHAIPNAGSAVSPYGPTSRLYRNPLYLDVEAVPEWTAVRATPDASEMSHALDRLRVAGEIDYDAVREAKLPLLRACHAHFVRDGASARTRAYRSWCAGEGEAVDDFATFTALDTWLGRGVPGGDWRRWPDAYHDPASSAVASFRKEAATEIDFQRWLQFEIDRQLGVAAAAGRAAGLRVGLYPDLAVGSLAGSADTWSGRARFAEGVSVGAPPDAFSAGGQSWGVAALHPANLREDGFGWFAHLLRNAFRHAGALRIDHVIGLQRLYWIPEGRPASEGAYVRYPFWELLGVLALESRRAEAVVIGEDLGTVSPEVAPALASWGILSSSVLAFEREEDGAFRPAARVSARALGSAGTHDLAPLAGYFSGRDLALRSRAGERSADTAATRAAREAEREALVARLRADEVWTDEADPGPEDWCRATSAWLARTPAPLVAVSLDDLVGEVEPVHLPGISSERHPSWRRRMRASLETLVADERVRDGLPPGTFRRTRSAPRDEQGET